MAMDKPSIPEDLRRFVLTSIPSVPFLEALLLMRAGVRYRIGVRGYRGGWSGCQAHIEFAARQCGRAALAQGELLGATALPEARPQLFLTDDERATAARIWNTASVPGRGTVRLIVGVGAGVPTKAWDARQVGAALAQITQTLEQAGDACDIVIVGSKADQARAAEAIAAAGPRVPVRSVAGEVPMRIMFALTEQAGVVLTNSTMLMHVAAGKPVHEGDGAAPAEGGHAAEQRVVHPRPALICGADRVGIECRNGRGVALPPPPLALLQGMAHAWCLSIQLPLA